MSFVPLPLLRLFVALSCLLPGLAYGQIIVPDVVGSNLGYTFVEVGDPQNPDDDETTPPGSARGKDFENAGVGYVGQVFAMGQSEVTNEMYARFLNAVASTDRLYGLYSDRMNPDKPAGGGIRRLGTPQTGYTYTVEPGFEQQPVGFVSGFDAMRFCNWLHNGMPGDPDALDPSRKVPLKGDQDASSTEDGAYTLLGANTDELIRRNPGAKYFLPDQDEWHKAAYYDPSPGSTYWWFADQTYVGPGGNYDTIKINGVDYRVLKDVKASGTPSHYGTFDQDGNVNEWLDAAITATIGSERYFVEQVYSEGATAGSFTVTVGYKTQNAAVENRDLGFRVALLKTPDAAAPLNALMVEVDEPENLADEEFAPELGDPKLGAVNYVFQMGAYEVTNREYAKFLNAKANGDSFYRLYDTRMGSDEVNGGITRTGPNGSYVYAVKRGMALKPVVYVSIFSAMRYCNWLHNGGRADSDMEAGAYRLLGNIPTNTANLTRNATARYYLPNANEFYKAAYYDPFSPANATFNYWKFATRSDSFNAANNSAALAAVDAVAVASYFGTYGQSGNVGYVSPGSGANTPADEPTADNTGELLEEADNTQDEFSNRTFRIAAAAGMPSLLPLGDEDGDGLSNRWEVLNGLDPRSAAGTNGASGDPDLDGLTNLQELQYGLDPLFKDSDVDSDGDGLSDLREAELGTRPDDKDSDDDLLEDGDEVNNHRTDPLLADTDNDGVSDFQELLVFGTNPLLPSSVPDVPSFVEVGNPGNPDEDVEGEDSQNAGIGYVGQKFEIGTTEVTNLMYARFLNAVARSDALYGLYSAEMGSSPRGGIVRSGSNGSYTYTVKPGFGGRPVNYVSVFDAMRYCNWLHNGMPTTGGQNASTTEDGAYELNGTNPPEMARRSFGAKYFLPDQDEWHKAAYYDPAGTGSSSEDYWLFADRSAMGPGGNFGVPRNKLVGTTSGTSRYGTFDQDGNIREWLDASIVADERLVAVGGCVVTEDEEDPTIFFAVRNEPESEKFQAEELDLGFRVARPVAGAIVTQETVPLAVEVGQPGNLADEEFSPELGDDPIGAVGYTFQMGAYEVTNREYTKFLNAKAKEDSFYRLYDTRMGSDSANGGIERSGANGSHTYKVKTGFATKPVVYVSIYSAMRYCNWLHNGGRADSDMESGAYRLLGNIPTNTTKLTRNATARYYLPNATEFYKAAYYDPSSLADANFDYWKFATRSDTFDANNNASTLANVDFSSMASYFGTYGQSGNVGYVSPGSGANAPAGEPTAANTGELLEEATNSDDESATRTFRIAAAAGVQALRPLGDEDSDGMSNAYEIFNDLDPRVNDAAEDPDKDGLTNLQEFLAKTDPRDADTDSDGMDDGWEVQYGLNPRTNDAAQDPDEDGLTNLQEFQAKTDPKDADTDNDGMDDGWEVQYGFDPKSPSDAAGDFDRDGLSNLKEFQAKTDPKDDDTDNDGLLDGNEVTRGTNPLNPDTDGDTLSDGDEVNRYGTDPKKADTDGDGLADNTELLTFKTNPLVANDRPFFVPVGNPENPDDDGEAAGDLQNAGRGYVAQEFDMSVTEVTNWMYAKFLNSVAKRDRLYGLYKTDMGDSAEGGIIRRGAQGSYSYEAKPGFEGKPVNFVSLWDALRYINWLHNWKVRDPQMRDAYRPTLTGAEDQNAATTEDGVYALRGTNPENFTRHPAAQFFLPDVDEWHKAAYYDPDPGNGRPAESYWDWATQKMNPPTNEGLEAFSPTLVPVGTASGNYAGPSHYGTFDQDGNVAEWVQDALILGGRKTSTATRTSEIATLGFRVAQPVVGAIVTQETVPLAVEVGQPGNLADEEFSPELGDDPIGAVGYTFQMGAYEVTNREYTKFLNAKAKEDSFYRLYDTRMGSDSANGGIERSGANGSHTYKVKTGFATKPVVYVSIYSAMRYCNWLHNGGRADSDMESGAYRLLGNIPTNTTKLTRNATARYYLPNATEFYKAAYYDPSSLADANFDYWKFATRSDTFDANNNASTLANVDFSSMASYFGTYGQSGNVGYVSPGSGANAPAGEPTAANTGELLEEATNSDDESATRTFRIAAAAGVQALRPLGDEDSDGMSNAYEIFNDLDPRVNDAAEDPDKDGLTNLQEFLAKTDPRDADTDSDGMDDGWEVQYGLNPRTNDAAQDPDEDGLTNLQEFQAKTDPKDADTDNDGMDDGWEVQYGFDPKSPSDAAGDFDRDGLSNLKEFQAKTDPKDDDTDNDGLLDGNEVTRGTNPLNPDTDGDTLSDGDEVNRYGTDPLKLDTDGDGFADNIELQQLGTNPLAADNEPFFVRVGDPGNPDDDVSDQDVDNLSDLENDGMGHVGQAFDMGMTEVTNLMYAKFLNAVAKSDSLYGLYSTLMGTESTGGIIRQGASGNYRYVVKPGYEGRPVNFVSAFDAMRYCNWLHNGSPATGVQNTSTTEDGAYPLRGKNQLPGIKVDERERVRRSFGAKFFLPDEDEWHKAAYYDPDPSAGRPTDSYWPFADQTTSGPGGNFSDVRNRPVASSSGRSHYGTFDQDGNVGEWTEGTIINGTKLSIKNGSAGYQAGPLTLHIDILADKFWLTGQTQGVFGASQRRAVWATFPPATSADPQSQTTNVGMVGDQTKVATLDNGLTVLTAEIGSTVWPNGGFRFALKASGAGLTTIRGAGKSAAIDVKGVDTGAILSFREGLDLSAVFEAGDSSFGPLTVKDSDIDDPEVIGESDASEPLPAESERRDVGFRIAKAVTPPPVTQALLPRMVAVGSPRNTPDLEGKGAVDYEYQIGAYEVTNAEYAAFLNAVAADDSVYRLYDIRMGTGLLGGIDRSGSPGAYTYAAKTGFANKPVNYVTFFNALRYCNWLHNGAQSQGNTEFGAYRLLGELPSSTESIRRNFGARYFLPNEDEWHKAAYYDPSSAAAAVGNYWDYATRSQSPRFGQIITASLTGLAEVSKPGIASYFGTYGQNGNAAEWVENVEGAERLVLGGGLNSDWASPDKAVSFYADPTKAVLDCGFRIAARVEAPSTRALATQTIKFTKLPAKRVLGTKPLKIRLRAKATSKLKPEFVIDDPGGIATYVDGKVPYLLVTKPGTLKITARQPGLGRWAAAEEVQQTIEIVPRLK